MPNIFVCYARADCTFVEKLVTDLRSEGISLWFDQHDIQPGDQWDSAVENALVNSPTLLIVLSPNSTSSQNVMDELAQALKLKKRIVPILHQPCSIPFRIGRLQYVDFTTSSYESRLKQLKMTIGAQPPVPTALALLPLPQVNPDSGDHLSGYTPKKLITTFAAVALLAGTAWAFTQIGTRSDSFHPDTTRPSWCSDENLNLAERTVCEVERLWPLDNELNDRYQAAAKRVGSDANKLRTLQDSEATWLQGMRNKCGADATCLDRAYRNRIPVFAEFRA
jgi:uncharacterized protein YecT (DUF1311 family)